jgi:hypothetical protein
VVELSERRRGRQEQQNEEHEIAGNEVAEKELSPRGPGARAPGGDWMDAGCQRAAEENFKSRTWTIKRRRHASLDWQELHQVLTIEWREVEQPGPIKSSGRRTVVNPNHSGGDCPVVLGDYRIDRADVGLPGATSLAARRKRTQPSAHKIACRFVAVPAIDYGRSQGGAAHRVEKAHRGAADRDRSHREAAD